MNLGELIIQYRLQVPRATTGGITDAQLTTLLNQGVREVNQLAFVYKKKFTEFSAEVNKQLYNFSEIPELSDFLGIGKGILYYKNSGDEYIEIIPKTMKWMDESLPNWRSNEASDPGFYAVDGDEILFSAPFSSERTLRIENYLLDPTPMDNNNNYPWNNSTTELKVFSPLDQAIISFAKWKSQPVLGRDSEGKYSGGSVFNEFLSEVRKGKRMINRKRHLYFRNYNKMRVQ